MDEENYEENAYDKIYQDESIWKRKSKKKEEEPIIYESNIVTVSGVEFWMHDTYDERKDINFRKRENHKKNILLGSNNKKVEEKLRYDRDILNYKEIEQRGRKYKNTRYRYIDLLSITDNGQQTRIRAIINNRGKITVTYT